MLADDLSKYHKPIGALFSAEEAKTAWEKYRLSDQQVAFYEAHGYLAGVKILDEPQIAQLLSELKELRDSSHPKHHLFYEFHSNESNDPDQVLFHSLGHWRITPGFHDVLWNPRFVVAACQLLGSRSVRFWHDQLFCKPARQGGVVAWHQDYSYWTRTIPMQHLTCWVGLDDATTDNGCLMYIPGSHRWNLLDRVELAGDIDSLKSHLTAEQQQQYDQMVAVEMPAGYGTFHHPLLVHGSNRNQSDQSRRAFVINVFADGTRSDSDEELLQGVPVVPRGEVVSGQFFPMLFEVSERVGGVSLGGYLGRKMLMD